MGGCVAGWLGGWLGVWIGGCVHGLKGGGVRGCFCPLYRPSAGIVQHTTRGIITCRVSSSFLQPVCFYVAVVIQRRLLYRSHGWSSAYSRIVLHGVDVTGSILLMEFHFSVETSCRESLVCVSFTRRRRKKVLNPSRDRNAKHIRWWDVHGRRDGSTTCHMTPGSELRLRRE